MKSINNRLNRLLISVVLGIPSYAIFALIRNFPFERITLYAYLQYSFSAAISFFVIFELQHWKSKWLNSRIEWGTKLRFRIFWELWTSLLITIGVVFLTYSFLYKVIWKADIFFPSVYFYVSLVFFISLSFMAFVNAVPLIEEWKRSILLAEMLEKENVQAKMEALQTQLSPHFFFNNLSVLNGLISESPSMAKKYISKMSEVFRYILAHKNDEIVALNEELGFLNDYIFLLETRFKDKFNVKIQIDDMQFWIPPVTLQQLIENAIKHNEASFSNPLEIRISQKEEYLIVENNIRLKRTNVDSLQTGITNITQRFDLLTDKKVSFNDENDVFTIKIPLISNYESSDS